ncbi:MAG: hypothetical protein C0456_14915 [Hyphomonas sp.]|nr:hypothetical protein [Hyphomonas sp.]
MPAWRGGGGDGAGGRSAGAGAGGAVPGGGRAGAGAFPAGGGSRIPRMLRVRTSADTGRALHLYRQAAWI